MKRIKYMMVLCLCICGTRFGSVEAEAALKIRANAITSVYEGTQVKVSFDRKQIDISKNPGIVVNNVALLPYEDVFKAGLGVTCQYNSSKKQLVLKKNGNKVIMTVGSTIAYVNGIRKTVSVTPRQIYFYGTRKTKLMVPSRFVAEALGYTYKWNSSTGTAQLSTPYSLYYNNKWHIYNGTRGFVTVNGSSVNVKDMPTIVLDGNAFVQAQKVFGNNSLHTRYTYNKKTKVIKIQNNDGTIQYKLNSSIAYVNRKKCRLKTSPKMIKDNVSRKNYVMIPAKFTAESLGLEYEWNASSKTSEITLVRETEWLWLGNDTNASSACNNTLESIRMQKEREEESIIFTGRQSLCYDTVFSENENTVTISIANLNNISTKSLKKFSDSENVRQISISECETGNLTVTIKLAEDSAYFEESSGNTYMIHFCTADVDVTDDSIELQLPEGVVFSEIKDEDCYYANYFKVIIPGSHESYYKNISETLPEGIKSAKCTLNEEGETVLTFYTQKVLGYKLQSKENYFVITVGEPRDIYESIVLLDPGHGGVDPGAVANGVQEKNFNFNILYKYAKKYFNDRNSPVKAYWTRTTDKKIELESRAEYSKIVQADVFISLHMNSAASKTANGTETYYTISNNKANSYGLTSKMVAQHFQNSWPSQLGLNTSRGVRTANYIVTKKNSVPAVLIELGFVTSQKDISLIGTAQSQNKAAKTFYQAVCDLFEKYPTGR